MIRFIDLRGQETGYRFAFFDTVADSFIGPLGYQAWDTEADLRAELHGDPRLERMVGLLPGWARGIGDVAGDVEAAAARRDLP